MWTLCLPTSSRPASPATFAPTSTKQNNQLRSESIYHLWVLNQYCWLNRQHFRLSLRNTETNTETKVTTRQAGLSSVDGPASPLVPPHLHLIKPSMHGCLLILISLWFLPELFFFKLPTRSHRWRKSGGRQHPAKNISPTTATGGNTIVKCRCEKVDADVRKWMQK